MFSYMLQSSRRRDVFTQSLAHPFGLQIQRVLIFITLLIMLVAVIPLAQTTRITPRVQPQLLALATQHPEGRLNVIVQKLSKDDSVEHMVTNLGGVVTKNLHIINAFAADIPARAVLNL